MIRPFTVLCGLLAAMAGLFLYQAKQRTLQLDRRIDAVLHETELVRGRTALLRADYAELSRPDRLLQLSQKYLALQPTSPSQFVELSALAGRLPAIGKLSAPFNPDDIVSRPGAAPAGGAPGGALADALTPAGTTLVSLATKSTSQEARPLVAAATDARPSTHSVGSGPVGSGPVGTRAAKPGAARVVKRSVTRLAEVAPPTMRIPPRGPTAPMPHSQAPVAARAEIGRAPTGGESQLGNAGAMAMPPPVPVAD